MKIMQLLPELNSGGVERGTLEIARALVAQGHTSLVVSNGGRMVNQLEAEGSTHLKLAIHKKSLSSLWQIRPLRQLIVQHQPDIVHVRSRVPAWLTHFALKGIPAEKRPHLISTVHGFYSINRYSQIMTQAEKVIAVSDSVVKYIRDHYQNCPPEDIVRIYRGIDPAAFPHGYQPSAQWIQQTYQDFPELEHKFLICFLFKQTLGFFIKKACHDSVFSIIYTAIGGVAKLVDALDLGSSAARRESSSLSAPTTQNQQGQTPRFFW